MVERFSRTERLVHWLHAVCFFGMFATGLVLYLPSLAGALGSRNTVKTIHLTIAAAWVVGLLLVAALGDRRRLRRTARELERFDADDRDWLHGEGVVQGRFNAGQKVHTIVQAAFATLFLVSGALLFAGERNTRFRLDSTILLHDVLAFAAGALVLGHLYLALVHPTTRPALRGMALGTVDADWARRHHGKWDPRAAPAVAREAALRQPMTWTLLGAAAAVAVATVLLVWNA